MKEKDFQPFALGVFLSLAIFLAIVAQVTWFPSLGAIVSNHKRLFQAVVFTAAFCSVWIYLRWDLRRTVTFWAVLIGFLGLHSLAILSYSVFVRAILVWQWTIVLYVESILFSFLLEWARHKNARNGKRRGLTGDSART